MGLFADTFAKAFSFWTGHFSKLFKYQLLFLLFYGIGAAIIVFGLLAMIALSMFSTGFFLPLIVFVITLIAGVAVLVIFNFVQVGGYSLIVKQAAMNKEINITEIFTASLSRWNKLVAVGVMEALPMIIFATILFFGIIWLLAPSIGPITTTGLFTTSRIISPSFTITGMATVPTASDIAILDPSLGVFIPVLFLFILAIIPIFLVVYFVTLRLWVSTPVLMLEKKEPIDSLKRSWALTSGKFWSIFGTIFLIGIVVRVMNSIVTTPFQLISLLFLISNPILSYGILYIGSIITYLIFTPIVAIAPAIYYLNMTQKKIPEEKTTKSKK